MAEKKKNRMWIIGAVCVAGLIAVFNFSGGVSSQLLVDTAEVTSGSIESYIDERARTSLPHIYHITMPMQGRVLPVSVEEGDYVKTGDLVMRLEDIDWQEATIEAESIVTTFINWLEASGAQLKAAKIRQDFDKWEWERNKKLAEESAISERHKRDSKRNYLDSNVQIESSQAMYYATQAMQSIVDLIPGYVKRNLDRTLIKSPVSGTILKRHVWNEKVMTAGSPLLDIGDLSELEVTADILTEEAVHIHPGDSVEIYGESFGDFSFAGEVRLIEPKAFTTVSSLGVEEQRVAIKITFTKQALEAIEQAGLNLGLQYRVRVKVITAKKESVLTVPRTALFYGSNSNWQLYQVKDGRARLTNVKVGLLNDKEAEIVSGLAKGDTIIVVPQSNLEENSKVQSL